MEVTIFIEQIGVNWFRASTAQPVPLESRAPTRDEALAKLRELAEDRLNQGEVVQVELGAAHPLMKFAGLWKDHPDFDEYLENIAEYKRQQDEMDAQE
jgi:hypothetical protein